MAMNILLVEDDAALAAQLTRALEAFGHRTWTAIDGLEALAAVARQSFDAVVLDRMLPSLDGLTVLQRMRDSGVKTPVIMLTALGRVVEKVEGLHGGADDYLVKPIDPFELNARLQAARRGRDWSAPGSETITAGDVTVSPTSHRAWYRGEPVDLSKGEFGILAELARHKGEVVTRAMLYERLWGVDFQPTTNIADAHVRRLRQKLVAAGGADPILTVRGIGYRLEG